MEDAKGKNLSDSTTPDEQQSSVSASSSDSREKLIGVAIRLFAEKGLEGVSTREIAGEAGVNISLISYYFGGKEGLYKTAIREFAEKAHERLTVLLSAIDGEDINKENYVRFMHGMLQGMIGFKMQSPQISELMMREVLAGLPLVKDVYTDLFSTMAEKVMGLMLEAQKKKIIRADVNVHTLFFSLVHSVDCYFFASKCDTPAMKKSYRFPDQTDEFIQQMVKIFIEGVLL